MSYFVYFAFTNPYSGGVFSADGFSEIYDQGIFKYRVLGINLLRLTHEIVVFLNLPTSLPVFHAELFPNTTAEWYSSFFYLNVLFLGLTMSVFFVIAEGLNKSGVDLIGDLLLTALLGIMVFTQYVIVPYDMLSYFFLAIAIYLILLQPPLSSKALVALCAIVILGALTRETAALMLSLYAAVHFERIISPNPDRWKYVRNLAVLTLCFIITYVVLRLFIETGQPFYKSVRIEYNFTNQFSLFGILFFVVSISALLTPPAARTKSLLFVGAASPYIFAMILIANPREIRLWAPVLLPIIVLQFQAALSSIEFKKGAIGSNR